MLADGPSLPRWWPAVYLSVHTLNEGDHDGVGSETALLTKGWLPYMLRWTAADHRADHRRRLCTHGHR